MPVSDVPFLIIGINKQKALKNPEALSPTISMPLLDLKVKKTGKLKPIQQLNADACCPLLLAIDVTLQPGKSEMVPLMHKIGDRKPPGVREASEKMDGKNMARVMNYINPVAMGNFAAFIMMLSIFSSAWLAMFRLGATEAAQRLGGQVDSAAIVSPLPWAMHVATAEAMCDVGAPMILIRNDQCSDLHLREGMHLANMQLASSPVPVDQVLGAANADSDELPDSGNWSATYERAHKKKSRAQRRSADGVLFSIQQDESWRLPKHEENDFTIHESFNFTDAEVEAMRKAAEDQESLDADLYRFDARNRTNVTDTHVRQHVKTFARSWVGDTNGTATASTFAVMMNLLLPAEYVDAIHSPDLPLTATTAGTWMPRIKPN